MPRDLLDMQINRQLIKQINRLNCESPPLPPYSILYSAMYRYVSVEQLSWHLLPGNPLYLVVALKPQRLRSD